MTIGDVADGTQPGDTRAGYDVHRTLLGEVHGLVLTLIARFGHPRRLRRQYRALTAIGLEMNVHYDGALIASRIGGGKLPLNGLPENDKHGVFVDKFVNGEIDVVLLIF